MIIPTKGQQEFCCCDGCDQSPIVWGGPTLTQRGRWKLGCCGCVPKYACVTVIAPGGSSGSAMFKLDCPSPPYEIPTDQPLYTGPMVSVGGRNIDLQFRFLVADDYSCRFCVTSTELGIPTANYHCIAVDEALRAAKWCKTLKPPGQAWTEFNVDGYLIRIVAADHMTVTGRLPCTDEEGGLVVDTDPIRNTCCNCSCVCRCMCMTVSRAGEPATTSIGCYYKGSWIFANGLTVSLYNGGYARQCTLRLNVGPGYDVSINAVTNPCPRPEARWLIFVDDETVQYEMKCLDCAGGCSVSISNCCPSGRSEYPSTLYAEVTSSCAGCPVQTVALAWDSSIRQWVGNYSMCSGHNAQLRISCPFTSLTFSGNPCVSTSGTDPGATCDPILASFSLSTGGINCCPGQIFGAVTLGVVVHE